MNTSSYNDECFQKVVEKVIMGQGVINIRAQRTHR